MIKTKKNTKKRIEAINKQKKIPLLGKFILSIFIAIFLILVLLSLEYLLYFLIFSEIYQLVFGLVIGIPALALLIISILFLRKNNPARLIFIAVLTFFSFYLAGIIIGSIRERDFLYLISSVFIFLICIISIIYFSKNKKIKEVFEK